MTLIGPYNSPMALGVRPWACLFFAIWAVLFITVAAQGLAMLAAPEYVELVMKGDSPESYRAGWRLALIGTAATLIVTMMWAETVGAGPFAGEMSTEPNWLVIAVIGGPVVMIVSSLVVGAIFAGDDPNWHLQEGVEVAAYDEAAQTFAFVVLVAFIAPLQEEIAFRGIGLGCLLSRGMPPVMAGTMVTGVFALSHYHYTPPALIPVIIAGAFLAWLRIRSGSIAPPIAAHLAANISILVL